MDFRHVWILVTGLASVGVGVRILSLVAHARDERDRQAHRQLRTYGLLSLGGGTMLALYALFA